MPEHFCNPGGVSGLELTGDKSRYVPRTDNVEVQNDSLMTCFGKSLLIGASTIPRNLEIGLMFNPVR